MARKTFEFGGIKENEYGTIFVDYKYGTKEFGELRRMLEDYGMRITCSKTSYDHSDSLRRRLKSIKIEGFLPDPEESKKLEVLILNKTIDGNDFQISSPKLETIYGYVRLEGFDKYKLKDIRILIRKCARRKSKKLYSSTPEVQEREIHDESISKEPSLVLCRDSYWNALRDNGDPFF